MRPCTLPTTINNDQRQGMTDSDSSYSSNRSGSEASSSSSTNNKRRFGGGYYDDPVQDLFHACRPFYSTSIKSEHSESGNMHNSSLDIPPRLEDALFTSSDDLSRDARPSSPAAGLPKASNKHKRKASS